MTFNTALSNGFIQQLIDTSEHLPHSIAISDLKRGKNWSYLDFKSEVERYISVFQNAAIKEGDQTLLLVDRNLPEFVFAFYALSAIGAIAVPMKTSMTSFERDGQWKYCTFKAALMMPHIYEQYQSTLSSLTELEAIFTIEGDSKKQDPIICDHTLINLDLTVVKPVKPLKEPLGNPIISYHFTYKGQAKPLLVAHKYLDYNVSINIHKKLFSQSKGVKHLSLLPLIHVFGLVSSILFPLCDQGEVVMGATLNQSLLDIIEKNKVFVFTCTPQILYSLMMLSKQRKKQLTKNFVMIVGGAHASETLIKKASIQLGITIYQGYGTSETLPICATWKGENKAGSMGKVLADLSKIYICDIFGNELPQGIVGELCISGPNVINRYENAPELGNEYFKNGLFYTGDLAYVDKNNFLFFVARRRPFSKISGQMIDLTEVKLILERHPEVMHASVQVVDSEMSKTYLRASLLVKKNKLATENHSLDKTSIQKFAQGYLSKYKVPKEFYFYTATENGENQFPSHNNLSHNNQRCDND